LLHIRLVFLVILFLVLGIKDGGYFAVESGNIGFELFQLVFLTPCHCHDGFRVLGNVGFEFGGAFLVLVSNDSGYCLYSIDEVHAGGMGVAHGYESVVELVFVVTFYHKAAFF
jgi:hypothetical protein